MVTLTLSLGRYHSSSPDPPSSPRESSDIEEEEPHPRQRALHELPPPPSPSLGPPPSPTPHSSSSTSQRPSYPFGFVIFLDPTSKRAQQLSTDILTSISYTSPLATQNILEATHVIVGTSSFGDSFAREQPARLGGSDASGGGLGRAPFLVNLGWLEKSMKMSRWENEEEYLFVSTGGEMVEERGGLDTVPEEMSSEEEESLARYISTLDVDVDPSTQDEDGMDSFDRYLVANESNERSADELRRHYELGSESFFDHRVWVLRREAAVLEPFVRTERRKVKTRIYPEDAYLEVGESEESDLDGLEDHEREGQTSRSSYTPEEESDLVRCIRQSSSVSEGAYKFSQMHPHQIPASAIDYYKLNTALFGQSERHVAFSAGPIPRTDFWTTSEDEELVRLIATSSDGTVATALHLFARRHPERSYSAADHRYKRNKAQYDAAVEELQQAQPSKSKSKSRSRSKPKSSRSSSSFTTSPSFGPPSPVASTSTLATTSNLPRHATTSSQKRPLPQTSPYSSSSTKKKVRFEDPVASMSSSNPFHRQAPLPTLPSSSAPHRYYPLDLTANLSHIVPSNPYLSSSLSKSRNLDLAADRSSLGSSSLSCFFCWEDLAPFYSILDLAERSLLDMNVFVRISGGKQACSSCLDWFEGSLRMLEEGDEEGMGELERMAWATERLMELGREERRRFVGVV